jgi:RWP-RK domain
VRVGWGEVEKSQKEKFFGHSLLESFLSPRKGSRSWFSPFRLSSVSSLLRTVGEMSHAVADKAASVQHTLAKQRTARLPISGQEDSVREKNVLLVDAVVERAVENVSSFIQEGAAARENDDGKRVQRAAETLVAVLKARNPQQQNPKVRRVAITEDAIKSVFHLPISQAAQELGVGLTVLKKYCRIYEISRWPFRKLKSLDKLVSTVASIDDSSSIMERSMVSCFSCRGDRLCMPVLTHSARLSSKFLLTHNEPHFHPGCTWPRRQEGADATGAIH